MALVVALTATAASAMSPIGVMQSQDRFEIIAAGENQSVTINQPEYTFFSGDTIVARRGDAVLNFNHGAGGLGFPKGSRVMVSRAGNGEIVVDVIEGSLLYAFPEGRENFVFRAGNFTIHGQSREVRSIQVARQGESVGTIELLAEGNIRASVRSGALHIRNGDTVRYQVAAGETIGLLDLPGQTIQARSTLSPQAMPLILIQSPERVGTNEKFLIRWETAEPVQGDYVVIARSGAEPDEFETLVSSDEGNELEFDAPGRPGDYEIRFIDGETGEIKRFVYLDVVQDVIGGYWWDNRMVGALLGVTSGGTAIYVGSERDDDGGRESSVSP